MLSRFSGISKKPSRFISNIFNFMYDIGGFVNALLVYIVHKLDQLLWLAHRFTLKNIEFIITVKFVAASKFIWSGGRLNSKFRYAFVVGLALAIYLSGNVFQDRLVVEAEASTTQFLRASNKALLSQTVAKTERGEVSLSDEPLEYVIEEGDTLELIGAKYNLTVESIKYANNLRTNRLKIGEVLVIPPVEGTLHEVRRGDTIESLSRRYNVPTQSIVDFNYIDAPYKLEIGQFVTIPDAELPTTGRYYAGSNIYDISSYGLIPYSGSAIRGTGKFLWPLAGILSQGFHRYHPAIDIAANTGTPIASADKGVVIRAGWWKGGYGNAVQVDHGNGYVTTYAHMSSISVSTGQEIAKGQKLGEVGSTGRSTGPHLHFTVQRAGRYLNPLSEL